MGLLRPQGWLQQNGTPKLPVETLLSQPTLQGQWADIYNQLCYSILIWAWLRLLLFKGEWHVPRWPVCTGVRHTSGHSGELQVQKQRQISYPVVLLQRKPCTLTASLFSPLFFQLMLSDVSQILWWMGIVATLTEPIYETQWYEACERKAYQSGYLAEK